MPADLAYAFIVGLIYCSLFHVSQRDKRGVRENAASNARFCEKGAVFLRIH
jgi:hypothetical protein